MNRYKVDIFGDTYQLKSDTEQKQFLAVASMVDVAMCKIAKKSHRHNVKQVAVLAALQFAEKLVKEKEDYHRLCGEILNQIKQEIG